MILIADSGSTKTDWALIKGDKTKIFNTIGLNPFFKSSKEIKKEIKKLMDQFNFEKIEEIHFYGAGCSSEKNNKIVFKALKKSFNNAQINIDHDLLGAARATCGREKGICAILGTGSNSCLYDGNKIIDNKKALGFILGDEGSGAFMGKRLVQDYLNKELPKFVEVIFEKFSSYHKDEILRKVYSEELPNKFLASYAKLIIENKEIFYFKSLINDSFNKFFNKHICKYEGYKTYKLNTVGSVAFMNKKELEKSCNYKGMELGKVIQKPIEGLIKFHKNEQ